jgi:Short C-terminal domain
VGYGGPHMAVEEGERPGAGLGTSVGLFVSLAGVSAAITMVYLGMRSVMAIGGACAEGGPFTPVHPCPKGIPAVMVGGIWLGLIFAGLYVWQSIRAGAPSLAVLLWPALFLSLGWNFLEFGVNPPREGAGLDGGWLVCAVVFLLMGAIPLALVLPSLVRRFRGIEPRPGLAAVLRTVGGPYRIRFPTPAFFDRFDPRARRVDTRSSRAIGPPTLADSPLTASPPPGPGAGQARSGDLVSKLERLAALHRAGALDDQEYEAAKREILASGGAT